MVLSALLLGFAGSLHCVGMCSPLILSVTSMHRRAVINRVVYNIGRILTYGMLGLFVSIFGSLFNIPQLQTIVTITLGVTLITFGIAEVTAVKIPVISNIVMRLTGFIKNKYAAFLRRRNTLSTLLMGMLNGLLPCGLTYLALTYCLTVENVQTGIVFMLMFGLGTFPAMIGGSSIVMFLVKRLSLKISRLTTIMLIGLGILLLARPLLTHHHQTTSDGGRRHEDITICR